MQGAKTHTWEPSAHLQECRDAWFVVRATPDEHVFQIGASRTLFVVFGLHDRNQGLPVECLDVVRPGLQLCQQDWDDRRVMAHTNYKDVSRGHPIKNLQPLHLQHWHVCLWSASDVALCRHDIHDLVCVLHLWHWWAPFCAECRCRWSRHKSQCGPHC